VVTNKVRQESGNRSRQRVCWRLCSLLAPVHNNKYTKMAYWAICLLTCNHLVTYNEGMNAEHVFKAVADHHRRHLLDILARTDGLTLTQLCAHLPMSRVG